MQWQVAEQGQMYSQVGGSLCVQTQPGLHRVPGQPGIHREKERRTEIEMGRSWLTPSGAQPFSVYTVGVWNHIQHLHRMRQKRLSPLSHGGLSPSLGYNSVPPEKPQSLNANERRISQETARAQPALQGARGRGRGKCPGACVSDTAGTT